MFHPAVDDAEGCLAHKQYIPSVRIPEKFQRKFMESPDHIPLNIWGEQDELY